LKAFRHAKDEEGLFKKKHRLGKLGRLGRLGRLTWLKKIRQIRWSDEWMGQMVQIDDESDGSFTRLRQFR
jgi:hypothetical protein